MTIRKLKPVEANDGSYGNYILDVGRAKLDSCLGQGGDGVTPDAEVRHVR